jgi:hypothetical protein
MAMKQRMKGGPRNTPTSLTVVVKALESGQWCPCRCHTSTSSAAASPAKTSQSPDEAKGSTGHARVFGQSTPDSFASYDPATSSWRTSQLSLLEEWSVYSGTWPRAGMTRSGTAYPLRPLVPLTGGTGSGLLPTPKVPRGGGEPSGDRAGTGDLVFMARRGLWPTPHGFPKEGQARNPGPSGNELGRAVNLESEGSGSLNPTWVEWLMGFPLGWTDLGA